jgi:hypothetical protein
MLDPDNPLRGQPLIAFRRELDPRPNQGCGLLPNEKAFPPSPARLDAALLKAWSSYRIWQAGQLARCSQAPGLPVRNIVPPEFCQAIQAGVRVCPSPPTSSRAFTEWLQASLNRVLGGGLPVNGIFGEQTRSALRNFQQRKGLISSGHVDRATQEALVAAGGLPIPCRILGSTPATLLPWSEDMLIVMLARLNPVCSGVASPVPSELRLFSTTCGPYKACALPEGAFEFAVIFAVDKKGAPIPSDLEMPKVSVDMEFTTDSGRRTFSKHEKDNSPKYNGDGLSLDTSFGNEFGFSSRESGRLVVRLEAVANWSGRTVTARYIDTVRCQVINCV